jgi:hypothetical protein
MNQKIVKKPVKELEKLTDRFSLLRLYKKLIAFTDSIRDINSPYRIGW